MGNNAAFTAFEDVILATYRHRALTLPLLIEIAKAFEEQDADSGGYNGGLVDGKDMYEIIVEVGGGTLPPKPDLPADWHNWTEEQDAENDKYRDAVRDAVTAILPEW